MGEMMALSDQWTIYGSQKGHGRKTAVLKDLLNGRINGRRDNTLTIYEAEWEWRR
jgi:hypothetical protein